MKNKFAKLISLILIATFAEQNILFAQPDELYSLRPWVAGERDENGLILRFCNIPRFERIPYRGQHSFFAVLRVAKALEDMGATILAFEKFLRINIKGTEFKDKENPNHERTGVGESRDVYKTGPIPVPQDTTQALMSSVLRPRPYSDRDWFLIQTGGV